VSVLAGLASRRSSTDLAGPEHTLAPARERWKIEHLHWLISHYL